jgi:hypothetical protein
VQLNRAVPLQDLKLLADVEKVARAEIYAPAVPLDLAVLSRPMVPAPSILPSMAGWSAAPLASCVANALDSDGPSAASGRTNVKVLRRIRPTLQLASITNAKGARRSHKLAGKRYGDRSTRRWTR